MTSKSLPESSARLRLERADQVVEIGLGWVHGGYEEILPQGQAMLSPVERDVLAALEFPRRRESYLLGRVAAKRALRVLLDEPEAGSLSIFAGVFDQPLVDYPPHRGVGVTITHAERLAFAVAFPTGHPMGIDVERIAPDRLAVLAAQMTAAEQTWARGCGLQELEVATMLWTMKEALGKTLTTGLMSPWEIYATSEWACLREGIWQARFPNFAQYRAVTWVTEETVLSLALPRNSLLSPEALQVAGAALRGDGQAGG